MMGRGGKREGMGRRELAFLQWDRQAHEVHGRFACLHAQADVRARDWEREQVDRREQSQHRWVGGGRGEG